MIASIELPRPHKGQIEVLKKAERFNVMCMGRRWGKTTISKELLLRPALDGFPVSYFAPTYKDLNAYWKEIKNLVYPIIRNKSEQLKQIELVTDGVIDFWSLDDPDSGRGQKYKRVIIDECEKIKKFEYAWTNTVRPMLADYRGDAYLLSTPKGVNTHFHTLHQNGIQSKQGWASFQLPTSANPYIHHEEIEDLRQSMDDLSFQQEILAQFISRANKPWVYAFREDHINSDIQLNRNLPVYLSFDFNVSPMTCTAHQFGNGWYYTLYEWTLFNSGSEELCKQIIASEVGNCHLIVTGDPAGKGRSTISGGNINNYHVISKTLNIPIGQIRQPNKNYKELSESRTLTNSIFSRHPDRRIHPRCKALITDLRYCEAKDTDHIDKSNDQMSHHLDNVRYMDATFFSNFIALWKRA